MYVEQQTSDLQSTSQDTNCICLQAVWIQDFKCFNGNTMDDNSRPAKEVPPFRKTLEDLLERMGVPDPFRKPLADHDFRPAAAK